MNDKGREALPDVLKGFAVILVVLGHCIQEGNGAAYSIGQEYFGDETLPRSIFAIEGAKKCSVEFCSLSKTGFSELLYSRSVFP